jgi:hypothetical protein
VAEDCSRLYLARNELLSVMGGVKPVQAKELGHSDEEP